MAARGANATTILIELKRLNTNLKTLNQNLESLSSYLTIPDPQANIAAMVGVITQYMTLIYGKLP